MSSRINTLLKTFGLENRKYENGKSVMTECDFSNCDTILTEKREELNGFLQGAFHLVK